MSFRFSYFLNAAQSAVLLAFLSLVPTQANAAGVIQDFSATFPTEGTPGEVTVIMINPAGQTILPYVNYPVPGLYDYVGRHQVAARTGGATADQDVQNITSSYTVGGTVNDVSYPIVPFESGYVTGGNGVYAPSLVDGDQWLRLAPDSTGGVLGAAAWDTAYTGGYDSANHIFTIRISGTGTQANDQADGMGWAYLNAEFNGDTGVVGPNTSEEPNFAGSLGLGFDIYDNGGEGGNSISLHYGGTLNSVTIDPGTMNPNTGDDWGFNTFETGEPYIVNVMVTPGDPTPDPTLKGGTPFAVNNVAGLPPRVVQEDGMDGFLRLAEESGGQVGIVAFDYTMDGTDISASFKFRGLTTEGSNRADGMSFLLVPTDTYGETGADQIPSFGPDLVTGAPGGVEEANLAGAFGVGFDTFNSDVDAQDDPEGMPSVGNHISTHFNGTKLSQVNYALDDFDIDTSDPLVWHLANIEIQQGEQNGQPGSNVQVVITDGTDNSAHIAFADFIPGMNLDSVRPVFAARTGGAFDNYDVDDVMISFPGIGPSCDFDGNSLCDVDDIDLLGKEIIAGTNNPAFDLTGDGVVDINDQDQWRAVAATENGFAEPYLPGDANLDGSVTAPDLNAVGVSWQTSPDPWSHGDFNADGIVNAGDLNLLGLNWQTSIAAAAASEAVPEPSSLALLAIAGLLGLFAVRRRQVER